MTHFQRPEYPRGLAFGFFDLEPPSNHTETGNTVATTQNTLVLYLWLLHWQTFLSLLKDQTTVNSSAGSGCLILLVG